MRSFNISASLFRILRIARVLLVPNAIFYTTVLLLVAYHGGHNYAAVFTNPYCNRVQAVPSHTQFSNLSAPPIVLIHISDLHVSDLTLSTAKHNLLVFERTILPRWAPLSHALIASGDLVHAIRLSSYPLGSSSRQSPSEWHWLDSYIARINRSIPWLSTHGNHDSFGGHLSSNVHIPPLRSFTCPSRHTKSPQPRLHLHRLANNSLIVIAIDATVQYPLHRPLNFFGDAEAVTEQLSSVLNRIHHPTPTFSEQQTPNVLLFGHYPSSSLMSGTRIHALAKHPHSPPPRSSARVLPFPRFTAYVCGHFHNLHGTLKYGMQSVSHLGSLELETIDMVNNTGYRILTLDGTSLSVKTFSMNHNYTNYNFLDEVIVLNLPRAGLCSPGAGHAARYSTHIRLFSPHTNLQERRVTLRINGQSLGYVEKFVATCRRPKEGREDDVRYAQSCLHVYGVKWHAGSYEIGTHKLTLHSGETHSSAYVFSLDGSADLSSLRAIKTMVLTLFFGMSDFSKILPLLCDVSLLVSLFLCFPGLRARSASSVALALFILLLWFGMPVLVSTNMTIVDKGIGRIGLRESFLPSAAARWFKSSVDVPFTLSVRVFWPVIVPTCFLDMLSHRNDMHTVTSSWLFAVACIMLLRHAWSWCMEILGAHGVMAGVVSPCCLPLLTVCLYSCLCAKQRGKSSEVH